jgi:tetratricopeptide (TPR) repeat protein
MMRSPDDVEQLLAKAAEAAAQGRPREGRKFVRRALGINPDHPRTQLLWALELIDQPRQARYHLNRAAELGYGDPAIEYQVACVLLELGEIRAALLLARRAHGHIDDDFRYMAGFISLTGRLADASGHEEAAEQAYALAFELEPEMAWHGRTLAQFLDRKGRTDDALRVTAAALEYAPADAALLALRERLAPTCSAYAPPA